MAVDGLVTQGAMASVAMIASLLTVPNLCMADASLGAQQHIKILRLICINLFFCLNFNYTFHLHNALNITLFSRELITSEIWGVFCE